MMQVMQPADLLKLMILWIFAYLSHIITKFQHYNMELIISCREIVFFNSARSPIDVVCA